MTEIIPISAIRIGPRHRQELGDLQPLADSIAEEGLLQPIGVTEGHSLVFGERRLRACRDLLGWTEIPARVVHVSSIVAGEFHENQMRKDFTVSEREAIARTIVAEIGERRGRPNKMWPDGHLFEGKTRDHVAAAAGLGSGRTLQRVQRVIQHGSPEIIKAMDTGEITITEADRQTRGVQGFKPRSPAKAPSRRNPFRQWVTLREALDRILSLPAASDIKLPGTAPGDLDRRLAVAIEFLESFRKERTEHVESQHASRVEPGGD